MRVDPALVVAVVACAGIAAATVGPADTVLFTRTVASRPITNRERVRSGAGVETRSFVSVR